VCVCELLVRGAQVADPGVHIGVDVHAQVDGQLAQLRFWDVVVQRQPRAQARQLRLCARVPGRGVRACLGRRPLRLLRAAWRGTAQFARA
jgi:hypothetical protein